MIGREKLFISSMQHPYEFIHIFIIASEYILISFILSFIFIADNRNNHLSVRKSDYDVLPATNHIAGNKQFYSPRVSRREQITMEERAIIGTVQPCPVNSHHNKFMSRFHQNDEVSCGGRHARDLYAKYPRNY